MNKFKEQMAEIMVKIFQIVFAMMAIGMFLREKFDIYIFLFGVLSSIICLIVAIMLYYYAVGTGERS